MDEKEFYEFSETLAGNLDPGRIIRDVKTLSGLIRCSGSDGGEQAADLIARRMEELGIPAVREKYRVYRSLPGEGVLSAAFEAVPGTGKSYPLTPYVFSGCAAALEAELVYDYMSETGCTQREMRGRTESWRGKIVLTYETSYVFACQAHRAGAAAVITIWSADLAHHGTIGGVWGTPEPDDLELRYPYLPFAEIIHSDGEELRRLCKKGRVRARLDISMDNRIVQSSMPVATIRGRDSQFVLVSCHYDAWNEGATESVAAAAMMEMGRVLKEYQRELKRTVVLAWWSGHNDGRYSGSTWYCDHHYQELRRLCAAHINMDICGCRGANLLGLSTSMVEGRQFYDRLLAEFCDAGTNTIPPAPLERSADQTFWGADVPFAVRPKFSRIAKDGNIAFYWRHTDEDTLDKVDSLVALRDAQVVMMLAGIFANIPSLPAKFAEYVRWMGDRLREIQKNLSADFDLSPVFPCLDQLERMLAALERELSRRKDTDRIVVRVAGELTRLVYTSGSSYRHDPAVEQGLFPGIGTAAWLTPENTDEDYYLAAQTRFIRQRNRLIGQIDKIMEGCEYQMIRWNIDSACKKGEEPQS